MCKIKDGIVDIEKYQNARYKILWILKEGNVDESDKNEERDICSEFRSDQHKVNACAIPTFRKLIYATYGILYPDVEWLEIPTADKDSYEVIKQIAYININKFPGGAVSSDDVIFETYKNGRDDLLKQIVEINPNIIIFGGTAKYFPEEDLKSIGWDASKESEFVVKSIGTTQEIICYSDSSEKLCICAKHPSYFRISDNNYYLGIRNSVIEWERLFEM
jgi:hypothetical protein